MGPIYLFSGQGAQKPGMLGDLADVPEVASALAAASEACGIDLAYAMEHAAPEELNDTRTAQPAMCALSVGLARALEARGARPAAVLGFSLGQISALAVSGMLSDEDAFALVAVRARYMAEAAEAHPGCMSALLKADDASVRALCEECAEGDVLVPANYNAPGQIVVSGTPAAVARAEEAWASAGKRARRLATSGAFHSPLMADAAEKLDAYLEHVSFFEPRVPLICNVDARPLTAADARTRLVQHLTHPVRFQQSVEALVAQGADEFAEVGFGGVLVNLVKRIAKDARRVCIQDRASLEAFAASAPSPSEQEIS